MFPHVKPSLKAREAMREAAIKLGTQACCASRHDEVNRAMKAISGVTGHKYVKLVASGNGAIFAVANAIDGKIMIPDQGGWRGFKDYSVFLGKEVCTVDTDLGVIDLEVLDKEIKKQKPGALFVTSFAGYIAEQDIAGIAKVCRENDVLLVEDASGAIGDTKLATGDADVIVCSTGAPKILNLLSGGFISTDKPEILSKSLEIISACKINPIICAGIVEELKIAKARVDMLVKYSSLLKENLDGVIHKGKRGVCVGIEVEDPKKVAASAKKNGLITDKEQELLTVCPKYERFMKKGLVLELKKIDILEVKGGDILKIVGMLSK